MDKDDIVAQDGLARLEQKGLRVVERRKLLKAVKRIADQLADLGFYVLVPDYFHEEYAEWPAGAKMPTGPKGSDLMKWMQKYTWNGSVKAEIEKTCAYMTAQGVTDAGCLGFCWGIGPVLELA